MSKYLPTTVAEVMERARQQMIHPTGPKPGGRWDGRCQQFVRTMYGVGAWAPSAAKAWRAIPDEHKHKGGKPSDAPRGAALYFVTEGDPDGSGHVMLAAGVRTHDKAISTDYAVQGHVGYAPRTIPRWGNLKYVGWSLWTPFGELRA